MEEDDDLEEVDNLVDLIEYLETATKQEIQELLMFMVDLRLQTEGQRREQPLPRN
ncbi:hypothetical protein NBG4_250035 [Candidatus Sulfobium mesophilum]|uniref:Uncharacterized protein n=1 Tax=Candidatus Sulfobium mesophilum TaxID=2016548 RepID=A0A2U3QGH6_9BACT|nr:hypothetical protein NBG4_250035 [Candidatus Sulfobium mesophilum]